MPRQRTALLALFLLTALPTSAQALELGVQDDGRTTTAVTQDTTAIGGNWTRTTVHINQPGVADRIRDAHHAGQKIILTVGGTGTRSRKPSFAKALRYIHSLPRADRYTIDNEPDLDGGAPCDYRKGWMRARRTLGRRLLFGDFSPRFAVRYTTAVAACGPLPRKLDIAVHPYQKSDPLGPAELEAGLGNLGRAQRTLAKHGLRVTWWLTEFGYMPDWYSDAQAAWLWPRAVKQAAHVKARVLIAYTAQGESWNTRPGPLGWCSLTAGRACPGAQRPEDHRRPVEASDEPSTKVRTIDHVVQELFGYASA